MTPFKRALSELASCAGCLLVVAAMAFTMLWVGYGVAHMVLG